MKKLFLSVRTRLLALCLSLVAVLGGASVMLGYLILRDQDFQLAQQKQYDRFETIYSAQQAMSLLRHRGGQLNSAVLARDAELQSCAKAAQERPRPRSIGNWSSWRRSTPRARGSSTTAWPTCRA